MNAVLRCISQTADLSKYAIDLKESSQSQLELISTQILAPHSALFEISGDNISWEEVRDILIPLSNRYRVDFSYQLHPHSLPYKLMMFDMDSTLIAAEVVDEMGKVMGMGEQISAITELAMKGELNFDQALIKRVSLLKGLHRDQMGQIFDKIIINPGVIELMAKAKNLGIKTAIVSGGFSFFAQSLQKKLHTDYAFANELEFNQSFMTGNILGQILNAQEKANHLSRLCQSLNLQEEQVIAVGDGANDLLMLSKAGRGFAYYAKEKVRLACSHHISFGPMTHLLYLSGIE